MKNWRRNLILLWVTQILSLTGFSLVFPFIPLYMQELGITDQRELKFWTSFISGIPSITMGIMGPIWGIIADRYGRKLMLLRSTFAGSIILSLIALTTTPLQIAILRCIQGALTGTIQAAAAMVAAATPNKKLPQALGFISSSTFIGFSIGPVIGGISAEYFGYRLTFIAGGFVLLLSALMVLFFVREQKTEADASKQSHVSSRGWRPLIVLPVIGSLILIFFLRLGRTIPAPYLSLYIQEARGQLAGTASITGIISGLIGLSTALGSIILTTIGRRFDYFRVCALFSFSAMLFTFPLFFVSNLHLFALFYVISFFFLGGVEPLLQSSMNVAIDPAQRATLFGIQTTVGSLAWGLSPVIGGYVTINIGTAAVYPTMSLILLIVGVTAWLVYRRHVKGSSP